MVLSHDSLLQFPTLSEMKTQSVASPTHIVYCTLIDACDQEKRFSKSIELRNSLSIDVREPTTRGTLRENKKEQSSKSNYDELFRHEHDPVTIRRTMREGKLASATIELCLEELDVV